MTTTFKRYLPQITDENLARAFARLQSHEDMRMFVAWLKGDAREIVIERFKGRQDADTLLVWATVLQVMDDLIKMCEGSHDDWVRIRADKNKQPQKWEG
jgi:hypothetical protein